MSLKEVGALRPRQHVPALAQSLTTGQLQNELGSNLVWMGLFWRQQCERHLHSSMFMVNKHN